MTRGSAHAHTRRLFLALHGFEFRTLLVTVATYVRRRRRSGEQEFCEAIFEFSMVFYLMRINVRHAAGLDSDSPT